MVFLIENLSVSSCIHISTMALFVTSTWTWAYHKTQSIAFFVALLLSFKAITCIVLDEVAEDYIRKVIHDFEANPLDSCYDTILEPPMRLDAQSTSRGNFFCLDYLFGVPLHINHMLQTTCPVHHCSLVCGQWTDKLITISPRNPRLVFDVGENVILVQRYYLCQAGSH